jgi:DNA-binding response OmpR family regulator
MSGSSGLDLQHRLVLTGNANPIVFLTGHGDIPMTVQAMKAGAVDSLTKSFRNRTLLDAITVGIERDAAQRAEAQIVKECLANSFAHGRRCPPTYASNRHPRLSYGYNWPSSQPKCRSGRSGRVSEGCSFCPKCP